MTSEIRAFDMKVVILFLMACAAFVFAFTVAVEAQVVSPRDLGAELNRLDDRTDRIQETIMTHSSGPGHAVTIDRLAKVEQMALQNYLALTRLQGVGVALSVIILFLNVAQFFGWRPQRTRVTDNGS